MKRVTETRPHKSRRDRRIPDERVKEIRDLRWAGMSTPAIARKFELTRGVVEAICSGRTYKDL